MSIWEKTVEFISLPSPIPYHLSLGQPNAQNLPPNYSSWVSKKCAISFLFLLLLLLESYKIFNCNFPHADKVLGLRNECPRTTTFSAVMSNPYVILWLV